MQELREGAIVWRFEDDWRITQYDQWVFYKTGDSKKGFHKTGEGSKGVDILALRSNVLWLIEAKDYRGSADGQQHQRKAGKEPLHKEVAKKVRDTLAGLVAAAANADGDEQSFAQAALTAQQVRVVLHLEQPPHLGRGYRRAFDPSDVQTALKQWTGVRAIDPHPRVMSTADVQWQHWETIWRPR